MGARSGNPRCFKITINVDQWTNEEIEKICEERGITKAEFARFCVEEYLMEHNR